MIDPITTSALASGKVIQTISDIVNIASRASDSVQSTSLVEFTSAARVEPLTVIGADCINLEYLPDVLQSLQSIFTGYYLQAVALTAQIGDVKVIKLLDKLNPARNGNLGSLAKESLPNDWRLAAESYTHRLPTTKNTLAFEAEQENVSKVMNDDAIKDIRDMANLSVGKLINVTIKGPDGKNVIIPISLRLMVSQIPESAMTHLLTLGSEDTTLTERYHAYRAGRISFIKDLIFCQDLITEHKKALMKDKDGTYSEIISRVNNNKRAGFMTNNPSLAMASNLIVISDATALAIENKMGGKLSSVNVRNKIFESSYIMILVVIDRQWERVTFYHRGIAAPTTVGLRDIKISNKSSGPDLMDIMKAYTLGSNPQL